MNNDKNKTGRNDFCPCGSGKKYKKCCMPDLQGILDFSWRKLRATEGVIIDKHLQPYLSSKLPNDAITDIIEDFFSVELPETVDKELLFLNYFIPWLLFNWIPGTDFDEEHFDPDQTIAINYLKKNKNKFSNFECDFIMAMNTTYYSYYIILDIVEGQSLIVKDILLGTTHIIKERQATYQLKKGNIVFSRILTLDKQSIFIGMAPFVIPGQYYNDLIDFRKWLVEINNNYKLTGDALRNNLDDYLRDYFFETIAIFFSQPDPILQNTDNEALQFSKSYFKLALGVKESVKLLLPLTLSKNLEDFLGDAECNNDGIIKNLTIPWLKKGNKKNKSWETTVLGHITICNQKLILETNSVERTDKGKKLLTKYLGNNIIFQQTLIELPSQKIAYGSKKSFADTSKLTALPEVQEQLKKMAKKHWESWFDEPIPALGNATPREAAKSKEGKELLEALLLQYDHKDSEQSIEMNIFQADLDYIRSELKLD